MDIGSEWRGSANGLTAPPVDEQAIQIDIDRIDKIETDKKPDV
jgi:hypothetical protein